MSGYQPSKDGVLHADLVLQHAGAEQTLLSADSSIPLGPDDAGPGQPAIDTMTVDEPAFAASCGDTLRLRVKLVSGASDFIEVGASVDVP